MAEEARATRTAVVTFVVTALGAALLRALGILLDSSALSWLAAASALAGVAVMVVRLVLLTRRRRRARRARACTD